MSEVVEKSIKMRYPNDLSRHGGMIQFDPKDSKLISNDTLLKAGSEVILLVSLHWYYTVACFEVCIKWL